jgi:hypothetical protein
MNGKGSCSELMARKWVRQDAAPGGLEARAPRALLPREFEKRLLSSTRLHAASCALPQGGGQNEGFKESDRSTGPHEGKMRPRS